MIRSDVALKGAVCDPHSHSAMSRPINTPTKEQIFRIAFASIIRLDH